jgi:hypothetical protein
MIYHYEDHPLGELCETPAGVPVEVSEEMEFRPRPDAMEESAMVTMVEEGEVWQAARTARTVKSLTLGVAGAPKARGKIEPSTKKEESGYVRNGEDSSLATEIGSNAVLLATCDGHGADEHVMTISKLVVEQYHKKKTADSMVDAVKADDGAALCEKEMALYASIADVVRARFQGLQHYVQAGSTAATATIYHLPDKIVVVASNVGDSQVVVTDNKTGRVWVLSRAHNWDDPTVYDDHRKDCDTMGIQPLKVHYGTFNKGGIAFPNPRSPGKPFLIYKEGTAEIDHETREEVWKMVHRRYPKMSHGGHQSNASKFVRQRKMEDGSWKDHSPIPEYGHQNWGATADVFGQNARSFDGPRAEAVGIVTRPSVTIWEVPADLTDITIVTFSDGYGDWGKMFELGHATKRLVEIKPDITGQEMADSLVQHLLTTSRGSYQSKSFPGSSRLYPNTDDVSISLARFSFLIAPSESR